MVQAQSVCAVVDIVPHAQRDGHAVKDGEWPVLQLLIFMLTLPPQLSPRACEASVEKRVKYITEICTEPAERLVFVDESAVNMLTSNRKWGRAPKGHRAMKSAPFTRGERCVLWQHSSHKANLCVGAEFLSYRQSQPRASSGHQPF